MSEKIEAGTMVWCRDSEGLKKWAGPYKYIGDHYREGHAVWSEGECYVAVWDEITTTDPHTPKTPEYMPEGCELWGRNESETSDIITYGVISHHGPQSLKSFHSFAVKAGDGTVFLPRDPNHFTKEDGGNLYAYYTKGDIPAQILGAVMRKPTK